MKERGILLPVFSLPSNYGIGDFGHEAYEFVDILSENGIGYWEILPINACTHGAPYSPISYYALNEDYISLDKLVDSGLIEKTRKRTSKDRIIRNDFKDKYFREAFKKSKKIRNSEEYKSFTKNREIRKYAEYMSEKSNHSKEFYLFLQYIAYTQWMELKNYANSKGVKILGDMPAYPPFKSVETKYNEKYYNKKLESGAPPDYYNDNGQKWGSYIYDIKAIKATRYKYIIERYKYYLKLFDKVRVDYFRGYDSFFAIPLGKPGSEGKYMDGLGYKFFDALLKEVNKDDIIIEDLGDIREETVALREHYNFTRQKILQFAIDLYGCYDKDNDSENVLLLPGNHDCHTIYGWYLSLSDDEKECLKRFLANNQCNNININHGVMEYCLKCCRANLVIVSAQDLLGLDDSARINYPGTINKENWTWKLNSFDEIRARIGDFRLY